MKGRKKNKFIENKNTINWTAKLLSDLLNVNSFRATDWDTATSVFIKNKDIGKLLIRDLSVEEIEDEATYDNLGIFDSKGFLMEIYWSNGLNAKQLFGIENQIIKRVSGGCEFFINFAPDASLGPKIRIVVLY